MFKAGDTVRLIGKTTVVVSLVSKEGSKWYWKLANSDTIFGPHPIEEYKWEVVKPAKKKRYL